MPDREPLPAPEDDRDPTRLVLGLVIAVVWFGLAVLAFWNAEPW